MYVDGPLSGTLHRVLGAGGLPAGALLTPMHADHSVAAPAQPNPHRRRAFMLILGVVAGWGVFALAFLVPQEPLWIPMSLALPGFLLGWILPSFAIYELSASRRFHRMQRGVDAIGRWRVSPARMRQFAELHDHLNATQVPTAMSVPYPAPAGEFEVVIGPDYVWAGSELHPIQPFCDVQSFGTALQFHQGVAPVAESDMMRVIRVPIGADAYEHVGRVVAHFARVRERYSRPSRKWKMGLVIYAVIGAFILIVGWLTGWQ